MEGELNKFQWAFMSLVLQDERFLSSEGKVIKLIAYYHQKNISESDIARKLKVHKGQICIACNKLRTNNIVKLTTYKNKKLVTFSDDIIEKGLNIPRLIGEEQ